MMKKIFIALGVVVLILAGGVFYLLSNLDEFVRTAIEDYGTEAVGSQVTVGRVEISLTGGSASIYDFSIANPEGFSDRSLLSFSELSVALDLNNLSAESVGIISVRSTDPAVSYERANGTTNLDVVSARLAGEDAQEPEDAGAESDMQLSIDDVSIRNIQAVVSDSRLPTPVNMTLGDIELQNLSGTPAEITQQILQPLLGQLAANAARAFANRATELFGDQMDNLEDRVNETLDDTIGEDVREGLGNLFGN